MSTLIVGYIDPGSGTILLQVLLAGLIGSVAFLGRITAFVKKLFSPRSRVSHGDETSMPTTSEMPPSERRAA
ncbi:hypothetical protein [Thermopirellula anaerolimosa]